MYQSIARPLALFLAVIMPAGSAAHHGFGTFAMNEDIEITGTVTDLAWVNPHSWLYLDVAQEDGSVSAMRCEMRSATTLRRSGWSPDMFPIGEEVTITGSPDRRDSDSCYVSTVIFDDGSSIDRYGQRTPPSPETSPERALRLPGGDPNLAGDWATEQRVMTDPRGQRGTLVPLSRADEFGVGGVPEGQRPIPGARGTPEAEQGVDFFSTGRRPSPIALTEAGQAVYDQVDVTSLPTRNCGTLSIVYDWTSDSPVNRIIQEEARITLLYGRLGFERTIHMDMDAHPDDIQPGRAGHSIGRWEDEALVVDTVGFAPGYITGSVPHSSQLHVVEYFSLDEETGDLLWRFEATDPLYWEEPYTGGATLSPSNVPYDPPACEDRTLADETPPGEG